MTTLNRTGYTGFARETRPMPPDPERGPWLELCAPRQPRLIRLALAAGEIIAHWFLVSAGLLALVLAVNWWQHL